jgi:hypothetical protein
VSVETEMADPRGSANEPCVPDRKIVLYTRLQRKMYVWLIATKAVIGTYANTTDLLVYQEVRREGKHRPPQLFSAHLNQTVSSKEKNEMNQASIPSRPLNDVGPPIPYFREIQIIAIILDTK